MRSIEQLLDLNLIGIIPGPLEDEADFAKRAKYCLQLKQSLQDLLLPKPSQLDVSKDEFFSRDLNQLLKERTYAPTDSPFLNEGFNQAAMLYGFSPEWIPIFFSNYRLMPWQGGCAWIFQASKNSPTGALMQLPKSFLKPSKFLNIYPKEEFVAHELVHVGRMMFEEPEFEEILAYKTSTSAFRRWLGPIIQSSRECWLFISMLAFLCFLDIFLISFYTPLFFSASWLKLIPGAFIVGALIRLWKKQRIFNQCLDRIKTRFGNDQKAWAVLFRLTDKEIHMFSKMHPEEIYQYAAEQTKKSLRWQVIFHAYF